MYLNSSQEPESTYNDVFLAPFNPTEDQVMAKATASEQQELLILKQRAFNGREQDPQTARESLSIFRHQLLLVAKKYGIGEVASRDSVDLKPRGGLANTPIISANMNEVTGKRLAVALAMVGGIASLSQDQTDEEVDATIKHLRSSPEVYERPISIREKTSIHEFKRLINKRSFRTAVVTNEENVLVGILAESDIPSGVNSDRPIGPYMRWENLITGKDPIEPLEAIRIMEMNRLDFLPIVDAENRVVGVLPKIDAAMRLKYHPNIDTINGGLRAIFSVGALSKNIWDRVNFLLDRNVRDIMMDTAHYDQGIVGYRNVEELRNIAEKRGMKVNIIAGNVVTRDAVKSIIAAGANFVKIGIGPGAMCTTRIKTGVGRPQVSAVAECADEVRKYADAYSISDGGKTQPRDIAIDQALGADYSMLGTPFAGTYESPGDLMHDDHGFYKENSGMANSRSSVLRNWGRDAVKPMDVFRDIVGHRSEGIQAAKVYLKPGMESVAKLHHELVDGASSTAGYMGASSLQELASHSIIGFQTMSGFKEGEAKPKS